MTTTNPVPSPEPTLKSIAITPSLNSVAAGTTQQLKATGKYSDGSSKDVTASVAWTSSASAVATISKTGLLAAVGAGQDKVTAALNAITGSTTFSVSDNLVSISIESSATSFNAGTQLQLTALGTYQDGKPAQPLSNVTWTSSAGNIASVSNSGLVSALLGGNTTITAAVGAVKNTITLSIQDNLVSISISPSASTINVASTIQLQALGKYQDGKPAQTLSNVTWSSSASSLATVSGSGLLTGVKGGNATITATVGSISSSIKFSVIPVLQTIMVSPTGPAILVGNAQPFTATGLYNDASVADLTAKAAWSSSDTTKASMNNNGLATGVAAGPSTITATYGGISGTTALNVVNTVSANLQGNYAFTLESSDSRGAALYAGSITVDGNGNFTGVEDCNTASGVQQNINSSGTYFTYPDGRGNIVFSANQCHPKGITLRFILTATGTAGGLEEFDSLAVAKGNLIQQNTAAFNAAAINGNYVFRAAGIDTRVNAAGLVDGVGEVGILTADGAGNVSSGVEDINDNGIISGQVALTASTYSVNADGRGTLQTITSSGTTNYALYVVDSTRFIFLQTDSVEAVSGVAELQTAETYSTLSDSYSFLLDVPVVVYAGNPSPLDDHVQIGKLNFNAAGTFGGMVDENQVSGQYILSQFGINGRGSMQMASDGNRVYFFYMVSPQKMFVLQAFTYSITQRVSPATGEAISQTGTPYSVATLAGNYALETYNLAQNATNLAWLSMNGAGGVVGVTDVAQGNATSTLVVSSPVFITTPTVSGNGDLEMTTPSGTTDYLFNLVSGQKAWVVGLIPPLDGTIEQQ